jgi:hypothetical protein
MNRRNVRVVVVNDDSQVVPVTDTQWGGGTRNTYHGYNIASKSISYIALAQSQDHNIAVARGQVRIVSSVFCGRECDPVVYVRNEDIPALFGVTLPEEYDTMPAELKCDMIDEMAANAKPREAKRLLKAAQFIRKLLSIG